MTDIEGVENQGQGSSDQKDLTEEHGLEPCSSVQRGTPKQHIHEHHSSLSNAEGFEFEEFVLDFDDYDLLESIHTQLGSPLEPIRKFCAAAFHFAALRFCPFSASFRSQLFER